MILRGCPCSVSSCQQVIGKLFGPGRKKRPGLSTGSFAASWTPCGGGIGYPRDQPCHVIVSERERFVNDFVEQIFYFFLKVWEKVTRVIPSFAPCKDVCPL